ncbi:hypothetical protein ACIQUM_33250 [Amycolatopsis azurea]|uniref:hypothetical protein n=1 Tax=Amycolatopsis azurea TaxID=36819 RepID=UPI003816B659
MSLTSELASRRSPLAAWCERTFTGTAAVVEQIATAVREVRPVRPAGEVPPRWWAETGGAFGQRVADLVQPAPPYYALLGMIHAKWVSPAWAHDQAARYPSHQDLTGEHRARALHLRPAAATWLDLGGAGESHRPGNPAIEAAWADFLERGRAYLARHAPAGTLGSPGAEAGLARLSWLLTACEDVYRSGLVDDRLARLFDAGQPTADQLRGLVAQRQVDELTTLARQLHERGILWELRKLAGNPGPGTPLGIAGPTIVPHWADADLLLCSIDPDHGIDARGGTLVDVKTVVSVRDTGKVGRWLWQVLLYAWLDTADLYRIRRVGLLLGRHGILVTWPVDELAERLLGCRVTGDDARDAFHDIAGQIITGHGLSWPVI